MFHSQIDINSRDTTATSIGLAEFRALFITTANENTNSLGNYNGAVGGARAAMRSGSIISQHETIEEPMLCK